MRRILTNTCLYPGCGAEIEIIRVWKLDEPPKRGAGPTWMPLDMKEYPRDDVEATAAVMGVGERKVRMLKKGEEPLADETRRMPHFATCKKRTAPKAPSTTTVVRTPANGSDDPAPATPASLEVLMAELQALVGLDEVKAEVKRQIALVRSAKLREAAGLRAPVISRHLVFTGNPGTGKTTVARLIAGIYRALGVLSSGQLVETDRSGLVGKYVGHTAQQTHEAIRSALGGVLFIDEAYSLAPHRGTGADFGSEAIDALVKGMEDHRDDLIVIAAGYPLQMNDFISSNPGLASRFRTTIYFADYSNAELVDVFDRLAQAADFTPTTPCLLQLLGTLEHTYRDETFGNGRYARNVLEAAISRQACRLEGIPEPTVEQLRELLPEDLPGHA